MLEFICSTCGKRIQGDDSVAGKRVLCPVCNTEMTVPEKPTTHSPTTAIATPEDALQAKISVPTSSTDGSFREGAAPAPLPLQSKEVPHLLMRYLPTLVIVGIVLGVILLVIPAVQKLRQAAAQTQSTNNLKIIGQAFHGFQDANKRLPYNGTKKPYMIEGAKFGGPAVPLDSTTGSWAFMILSQIEQNAFLFAKKNTVGLSHYMCPGRGRPLWCISPEPGAWTDYFINSFLNDPNGNPDAQDRKLTLVGITDGTSNTILVGHGQINPSDYSSSRRTDGFTDTIFNGGSAALCRDNTKVVNSQDSSNPPSVPGNWGGPFPLGSLMCMADATVRLIPYSITGGTIADGKVVDQQWVQGEHDFGDGPGMFPAGFAMYLTPCGGECVMIPDS